MTAKLKLVVSNGKKKEEVTPFIKGQELREKLESLPSVYEREVFIINNLSKLGL